MPSVSKAQQAVMGQAWGLRKGLLKLKDIDPKYRKEIKSIADGDMTDKELDKFASAKSALGLFKTSNRVSPSSFNGLSKFTV